MSITVKIKGVSELQKAFAQSPRVFAPIFNRGIQRAVMVLLGTSRERTPIDTGFLRGAGYETSFEALIGRLSNEAPYASFVHDGTVNMQARPFMDWGVEAGTDQVNEIFERCVEEFKKSL
jgi:hypothetical protein